ncbi:hypothetical protein [Silicimonas sp. MF1-12-2]|uniref:hypothetical protein n=1 Tax=Silicimonas sp. MF1-12-2 TaxID=3384793 RepID=UPI0039B40ED4
MVSRLRDQLYFESRLLFGQSQNSIDGAEYDSNRALFQATLAGRTELGNSVIWPTLSYTIAQDDADAYIDAGSNPVAAATTTVRRAELGISFERPLALSGLGATLEGDAFLVGVDDSTQANTDARARISLGVRMLTSGGLDTSVRVGYEGASSESNHESFSVGFQTELKFWIEGFEEMTAPAPTHRRPFSFPSIETTHQPGLEAAHVTPRHPSAAGNSGLVLGLSRAAGRDVRGS